MKTVFVRWVCQAVYVLVPLSVGAVGVVKDWPRWLFFLLPLIGVALIVHLFVDLRDRRIMERTEKDKVAPFRRPSASIMVDGGRTLRLEDVETDADAVLDAKSVQDIEVRKIRHNIRSRE